MEGFGAGTFGGTNFGFSPSSAYVSLAASATMRGVSMVVWSGSAHHAGVTTLGAVGGAGIGGWAAGGSVTTLNAQGSFVVVGSARLPASVTFAAAPYIAWDGQAVPDATWTTQTVN